MRARPLFLTAFVLSLAPLAGATAAPQVLGLFATNESTPLKCVNGECRAQLSAFCLQQERQAPPPGTLYRTAEGRDLTLVVTAADGSERRLPAADLVRITTARGYWSVTVGVPESALAAIGAVAAAVEVGAGMSLVPVPVFGDLNPQSEQDIALATGPFRAIGTRVVAESGALTETIRVTGRVINFLPEGGDLAAGEGDKAWAKATAKGAATAVAADGIAGAHGLLRQCRRQDYSTLRRCLEIRHDLLITDLTKRYWDAARDAGS